MIKKTIFFARELWTLLRPYWPLLLANIQLTLGMVYMNVLFNGWYNLFYDALQNKAIAAFYQRPST